MCVYVYIYLIYTFNLSSMGVMAIKSQEKSAKVSKLTSSALQKETTSYGRCIFQ